MKLISLNIYKGCQEPERFQKILEFVKKENPDILGLLELTGWEENNFEKLRHLQSETGLKYAIFCAADSGYNLALLSKEEPKDKFATNEGFKTGMIKAVFNDFTAVLTHLNSKNEDLRLQEIASIKNNLDPSSHVILMGDMNSLSPSDNYNEEELLAQMKSIGTEKFGSRKVRKEAIQEILDFGFVDAIKKDDSFEYSAPTKYNKDKAHFTKLRLDYIFVTKNLLPKVKNGKIITEETNHLSDHFPVALELV